MKSVNDPQPDLAVMRSAEAGAVTGGHVLAEARPMEVPAVRPIPKPIEILQSAIQAGITAENFPIVKELMAMVRDEQKFENKVVFNKAFFALRREIATLELYADKQAKTDGGGVAYCYASEKEIQEMLDPVLFKHGFTMMFGQEQDNERTTAVITLVHDGGHEETRRYAVRSGATNRMKDATAADTGATTSAWRHLCIKWFGLKSRIREDGDPRNEGEAITKEQADELEHRCAMLNCKPVILEMAEAKSFPEILSARYPVLMRAVEMKERSRK